ncbi:MAG TPA: glutathione binding-like protein [Polyangiaceae bacterium]|jgi:glutathione S-transferase|nr:glutathione binding-like protein [Polyangiaceae bacterium]
MKLFFSPLAASLAPRIVAAEAGIALEYVQVDFRTKRLPESGGDYRDDAPLGLVPLLCLDDGTKLTETSVIVQYLADRSPTAGLAPPWGSRERYELLEWLAFIATELHKKVLWPIFNRSHSEDAVQFARQAAEEVFDHLERRLADRAYVTGERFSAADAYLAWAMCLLPFGKLELGARPMLRAYAERVLSRPSVQDAIAIEMPLAAAAIKRNRAS